MGLLTLKDGPDDVHALIARAADIATIWNESRAVEHGFHLQVGEKEAANACEIGSRVLKTHFSDPPSAFKRTAAVLVIGRLFPFIGLDPVPYSLPTYHKWMARIMHLMMPSVLASIKVRLTPCEHPRREQFRTLPPFTAWPSPHVKAEFLEWLTSLDSFPWLAPVTSDGSQGNADPPSGNIFPWLANPPTTEEMTVLVAEKRLARVCSWLTNLPTSEAIRDFSDQRLARMVMATSLIIENAYYCSERLPQKADPNHVCYQCYTCIEKIATDLDLTFQNWIVE